MNIGVFNESPLHQALKDHYSGRGARQEVPVAGSFVADVLAGDDAIFEIQTGGFGSLRRKLDRVLDHHRVVLVYRGECGGVRRVDRRARDRAPSTAWA